MNEREERRIKDMKEGRRWKKEIGVILASFFVILFSFFLLPSSVEASLIPKVPNNLGLVGYWSFEDGAGDHATDFSGKGNTGTLTTMDPATDWVPGKIGTALDFDGEDDKVVITDPADGSLDFGATTDFTVAFWMRTSVSEVTTTGLVGKQVGFNASSPGFQFVYALNGGVNKIRFYMTDGANTNGSVFFGPALDDNVWHHIAASVDRSDNATIFVDGSSVGTTDVSSVGDISNTEPLEFGIREAGQYFTGQIDDVRIYNRALSPTEVASLYGRTGIARAKSAAPANGLIGYWSFSEGTGSSTLDKSGNGNTGTLNGMGGDAWVTGRNGNGLDFDGVDDYVAVAAAPEINDLPAFTWSGWVLRSSTVRVPLFGKGDPGGAASKVLELSGYGTTGGIRGIVRTDGTLPDSQSVDGIIADTTNWHHVAMSYDDAGDRKVRLYLDGEEVTYDSQPAGTGTVVSESTEPFRIARRSGTDAGGVYAGKIDEVRIYDRALTPHEIKVLYSATSETVRTRINSTPTTGALATGLVAHHTFDGGFLNTTTSTDATTNGNDGTLTGGPTPTIGKLGQALRFDGSDDYIQTTSGELKTATNFSISTWIKADTTATQQMIYWQGNSAANGWGSEEELHLTIGALPGGADKLNFQWAQGAYQDSGNDLFLVTNFTDTTSWHNVTIVVDGSATTGYLYLDGVQVDSDAYSGTSRSTWNTDFRIGRPGASTRYYDGSIDDVRIYNRALSAEEVLQLYNMGR